MSIARDRSHLSDAIHLLDARQLIDAELPALTATVDRSRATVGLAKTDLDEHRRWLERHHELYSEAGRAANVRSNAKASSNRARTQRCSLCSY